MVTWGIRVVSLWYLCGICVVTWGRFWRRIKVMLAAALSNFLEISSRTWKHLSANVLSANSVPNPGFPPTLDCSFGSFSPTVSPIRINRSHFFCIIKWRRSRRKAAQSQTLWKPAHQQPLLWQKKFLWQKFWTIFGWTSISSLAPTPVSRPL